MHGIDAWRDADAGRAELKQLTSVAGLATAGVRMHWLYFAPDSPKRLESAGFDYDSTWGYNDAGGYRAGTSQVFHLPGSEKLMELPLSIMDSALFYPSRMGLAPNEALQLCSRIVANARRFGGTLVINWHDRSLAPERLWGRCYQALLEEVGNGNRAWFTTAADAVDWFRWRRSIRFTEDTTSGAVTRGRAVTRREERGPRGAMTENGLYVAYSLKTGSKPFQEHRLAIVVPRGVDGIPSQMVPQIHAKDSRVS